MSFENKVAELCLKHFRDLPKTGKPKENEWTVLSCIVKQQNDIFDVVALGTGSKCIGKTKLCPKGTILNDSHAEIICRRSFLRYIYDQMLSKDSNILKFDKERSKFLLNDGVQFHFFTTCTPCGDAAIFPKHHFEDTGDIVENNAENPHPPKKRKIDDVFRTGAKCLENDNKQDPKLQGTEYHVLGAVRTKPGRGDPTLSVSCSDKIAKWCHLGIQGALLSILLEKPIYLSSFIISSNTPFCKDALERALYTRLNKIDLKHPAYTQKRMNIYQSNVQFEIKENKLVSPTSISWTKTKSKRCLEIAVEGRRQGVTKKNLYSEAGRLKICKLGLFEMFLSVCKQHSLETIIGTRQVYKSCKNLATDYYVVWELLKKSFGLWTYKDSSLLEFSTNK